MKTTLQALVVKKDDVTLAVEGINDIYTEVQIFVPFDGLTEEEINQLRLIKDYLVTQDRDGVVFGKSEAKDICGNFGCLNISIVDIEVEL